MGLPEHFMFLDKSRCKCLSFCPVQETILLLISNKKVKITKTFSYLSRLFVSMCVSTYGRCLHVYLFLRNIALAILFSFLFILLFSFFPRLSSFLSFVPLLLVLLSSFTVSLNPSGVPEKKRRRKKSFFLFVAGYLLVSQRISLEIHLKPNFVVLSTTNYLVCVRDVERGKKQKLSTSRTEWKTL